VGAFYVASFSSAFALLPSMFNAIARFAVRNPGLYFGLCITGGLAIRWFWCGQDIWRFINPMAPLFA
jgi:hypothetical protein